MNRKIVICYLIFNILFVHVAIAESGSDIVQYSPMNFFASGQYDGFISLGDLIKSGDFGIGTIQGLDGEMIGEAGSFYQINNLGIVRQIASDELVPLAIVTSFNDTDSLIRCSDIASYSDLKRFLYEKMGEQDSPAAIKIKGSFKSLLVRSVPFQIKPYPKLEDVIKKQSIFHLKDVTGIMVGFRYPEALKEVGGCDYHFHFINDEKTKGGHVLDCSIHDSEVMFHTSRTFILKFRP
jgi:acetolactate decarboxylase